FRSNGRCSNWSLVDAPAGRTMDGMKLTLLEEWRRFSNRPRKWWAKAATTWSPTTVNTWLTIAGTERSDPDRSTKRRLSWAQ
ncbi:hypothetical protein PMAYCL1PPCAC_25338, partial [Pristionchus mayeri]